MKRDAGRRCRCGSGLLTLFLVNGWRACPACVRWTLLQSNAATWNAVGTDEPPVRNAHEPVKRRRRLVGAK